MANKSGVSCVFRPQAWRYLALRRVFRFRCGGFGLSGILVLPFQFGGTVVLILHGNTRVQQLEDGLGLKLLDNQVQVLGVF